MMEKFRNGNSVFNVLKRDGKYALLERVGKHSEIVVACGICGKDSGYWEDGEYFASENKEEAMNVYKSYICRQSVMNIFNENIKRLGFEDANVGDTLYVYTPLQHEVTIYAKVKNMEYSFSTCCVSHSRKEVVNLSTPWSYVGDDFEHVQNKLKFIEEQAKILYYHRLHNLEPATE